jgi:hypothetical protein
MGEVELKNVDRLVKFAEMMLGQLKSAEATARSVGMCHRFTTGTEAVQHEASRRQFERLIQIGEQALTPFRSELTALDTEPPAKP